MFSRIIYIPALSILLISMISCSGKSQFDPIRPASTASSGSESGDVVIVLSTDGIVDITTIEHSYDISLQWDDGLVIINHGPVIYDFKLHRDGKEYSAGIIETGMRTSPLNIPLDTGQNGFTVTFSEKPWMEINDQIIHSCGFDGNYVIELSEDMEYVGNEILFGFVDGISDADRHRIIREHNLFITEYSSRLGRYTGRIDDGRDPFSVVQELENEPLVRYPGINGIMRTAFSPSDPVWNPDYPSTWRWAMERIQADRAWDIYADGVENGNRDATVDRIVLCIADTGLYPHEDFDLDPFSSWVSFTYSKCFVVTDGVPFDVHGHGTSVAGIAGAKGNNEIGLAGIVWDPYILALKCMGDQGYGSFAAIGNSIQYIGELAQQFPRYKFIGNYSLGGSSPDSWMQEATTFANSFPNTLLVGAAGNRGSEQHSYPASFDEFISVGASTMQQYFNEEKQRWEDKEVYMECPRDWGTNWSTQVDVCAPGTKYITTTNVPWTVMYSNPDPDCPFECPGWYCAHFGGTSAATPHVTGLAALLWNKYPNATKEQVRNRIRNTADPMHLPPEKQGKLGTGRINAYRALTDPFN